MTIGSLVCNLLLIFVQLIMHPPQSPYSSCQAEACVLMGVGGEYQVTALIASWVANAIVLDWSASVLARK